MKRLLLHFQNNTGVFGAKKGKEWYTSQNNVSDGYSLLFSLYMDPIHSKTLKKILGRTVDCCTFMIHEMRLDPSSQWFDWKVRVVLCASSVLCLLVFLSLTNNTMLRLICVD